MKQSFEVKAKTQLGQHFLADGRVIAQLIHAINPKRGEALLEIGPGLGALTLPLLRVAGALTALEVDGRVIDILRAKAAPPAASYPRRFSPPRPGPRPLAAGR